MFQFFRNLNASCPEKIVMNEESIFVANVLGHYFHSSVFKLGEIMNGYNQVFVGSVWIVPCLNTEYKLRDHSCKLRRNLGVF